MKSMPLLLVSTIAFSQTPDQVESAFRDYSAVFTLQESKNHKIPARFKRAIMFIVNVDPSKSDIRRREYNKVKDKTSDLYDWISGRLLDIEGNYIEFGMNHTIGDRIHAWITESMFVSQKGRFPKNEQELKAFQDKVENS